MTIDREILDLIDLLIKVRLIPEFVGVFDSCALIGWFEEWFSTHT
jgi:hypothetical protein